MESPQSSQRHQQQLNNTLANLRFSLKPSSTLNNATWNQIIQTVAQGTASSTKRRYRTLLKHMKPLPAHTPGRALELLFNFRNASPNTIATVKPITRYWHAERNIPPPPFHHPFIKQLIKGMTKDKQRPAQGAIFAPPQTFHTILRLWEHNNHILGSSNILFLTIQWHTLARFSDAIQMRWKDLQILSSHVIQIHFPRSKTDTTGVGFTTYMPAVSAQGFPNIIFAARWQAALPQDQLLFPSYCPASNERNPPPLTRSSWNHILRTAQQNLKLPFPYITAHSPRKSATRALREAGTDIETINFLGRWKSTANRAYLKPSQTWILKCTSQL
eukprot:GHVQ01038823.1.p1 GENE.GHVQ01038823.1~~GHVQ01038823.1.p1  ORF type:complete len:330 (-),score=20.46 GHVQ01038823.1:236-1225(-)